MSEEKKPHRPAFAPMQGASVVATWWDINANKCRLCGSKVISRTGLSRGSMQVSFEPTTNPECEQNTPLAPEN